MPVRSLSFVLSPRAFALVAPLAVLGSGCAREDAAADEEGAPATLTVEELPTPALPGSGEPRLSPAGDGVILSWLEPVSVQSGTSATADRWRLRMVTLGDDGPGETRTVAEGDDWFVNWADFPSVVQAPDGALLAHWLQREGAGTYDYGVRISRSTDDGATWSEPWRPHEDAEKGEHGFVTIFPLSDGGSGLVWLDGRRFAAGEETMTLRARTLDASGAPQAETLVDESICDCCQTDAALTSEGVVVVYRDRTEGEVRDIYATSLVGGRWTEGRPVHPDGWVIPACPVNGPAVDARGREVAVAWFAAPGDSARVQVAFSSDGGATFGGATRIDAGNPGGRVDISLLPDGTAAALWIERSAEQGAEIRVRRVGAEGALGAPVLVASSSAERASGFPRMVPDSRGRLVFAWTDVSGASPMVRWARVDADAIPAVRSR
jgi:hypothetical protein